jgi:hypothetical protein
MHRRLLIYLSGASTTYEVSPDLEFDASSLTHTSFRGIHNIESKSRSSHHVVQMMPFSSERKSMGIAVKTSHKRWRVFFKGASEILARQCTRHVTVHKPDHDSGSSATKDIEIKPIDELGRENISRTIIRYSNQMLRTIALCTTTSKAGLRLDMWTSPTRFVIRILRRISLLSVLLALKTLCEQVSARLYLIAREWCCGQDVHG